MIPVKSAFFLELDKLITKFIIKIKTTTNNDLRMKSNGEAKGVASPCHAVVDPTKRRLCGTDKQISSHTIETIEYLEIKPIAWDT